MDVRGKNLIYGIFNSLFAKLIAVVSFYRISPHARWSGFGDYGGSGTSEAAGDLRQRSTARQVLLQQNQVQLNSVPVLPVHI